MGDPSLPVLGPVRQFFSALREKVAKGRVLGSEPLDFTQERSENVQSFVVHDPISLDAPVTDDTLTQFLGWPLYAKELQMEDRFNAQISVVFTKIGAGGAPDTPWHETRLSYSDMSLNSVLELEEFMSGVGNQLVEMGKKKRDKKAAEATGKGK
jgi:hypothetical protein